MRFISLSAVILVITFYCNPSLAESVLKRVRRGNFGERGSGGLGASGSHGVGYGGTTSLGSHSNSGGGGVVFDRIALRAISGASNDVVNGYQAQINAQASSAGALDRLQQHGQHSAAAAGAAANQVGSWYNSIATGPVPAGYKGERGRK